MRPVRTSSLHSIVAGTTAANGNPANDGKNAETVPLVNIGSGALLRILLVEDNEINLLLARTLMQRAGHEVVVAHDGQSSIEAYRSSIQKGYSDFNLVLMDLHMPDMDGIEAIRKIREIERDQKCANVPILVLSADEQMKIRQIAFDAGANGFISKPIDKDQLAKAIDMASDPQRQGPQYHRFSFG
jgi:CheY-like chemotaxis protein